MPFPINFSMREILGCLRQANSIPEQPGMPWNKPPTSARDASAEAILIAFATMPQDQALEQMQSCMDGLTDTEANTRMRMLGANVLPTQKPPSWIMTLLNTIPNPFNILLIFLAIITVAVPDRDWAGFTVMLVMVAISVAVRFWQEYRSSLAVFRLQSSVTNYFKVRRQNTKTQPPSGQHTSRPNEELIMGNDLVTGDIVVLSPGCVIPADCLILEASFLRVSQSSWTGENEPVAKLASQTGDKEATLFDQANLGFMGTGVVSGNGLALVLRTGADVLIASMAKELEKKRDKNAFQRGIQHVSWMLIGFMCVMVPIVSLDISDEKVKAFLIIAQVLGISGKTTGNWRDAALFSISVAVGLVPEMLPAIVNANLARGAHVLSKMKAIVKRLDSIQNIGAMSVLCSDKTGTLTKDEISLCEYLDYSGATRLEALQLAIIDASVQGDNGNSIDSAILKCWRRDDKPVHIAHFDKVAAIPFTFERRRSTCIVRGITGQNRLICKGAVEEVVGLCSSVRQGSESVPLDGERKKILLDRVNALNRDGYRVLLVANKGLENMSLDEDAFDRLEAGMTLEGLLSFVDPPKPDAVQAITQLKELGVEVKVLTGDSLPVALNVCKSLGLGGRTDEIDDGIQAITGPELAQLRHSELNSVIQECKVFAKLTPAQKALIVGSLKSAGHCVGMLGDGINDCMALRRSDVGISVDSGASIAKDCADLILTEKGLDIIVASMVASSNFGNVFSVLAASAWLPFQPMLSIQLLAQNLLYDISQIAIPWDRVDQEYLEKPKRWNTLDLLRFIIILGPTSSIIDILTFLLGWFFYRVQTTADTKAVRMFQAHWFLQGLVTQTLVVHLLRTAKVPFIQSRAAKPLVISTVSIILVGFAIPWIPPFQSALQFTRPAVSFVGFLVAELLLYCIVVQLVKMVYIRMFHAWL
ncbi:hypothetical protein NM208_g10309 [Fusarium decemcellulare]|uniref:Uncharacterized protein n=1 Tax=Fusarium decemcellulare TaxID=57161 RepID=A0ACC1RYA9_9HYPO|nr:hypothetical protein NM208_g10309 [Fusarium decemcellulare]